MITRENLQEVLNSITSKDKNRIRNSNKEYVVIYLHIFNAGQFVTITTTNNYNRYKNVSNSGNAILELNEVNKLLGDENE